MKIHEQVIPVIIGNVENNSRKLISPDIKNMVSKTPRIVVP